MFFCFPNQASAVTLIGGENWTGLDNLKSQRFREKAVWGGTYDYNAVFTVDRGASYYLKSLGCVGIVGHNLTGIAVLFVGGSNFRAVSSSNVTATYSGSEGLYGLGQMTAAPATLNGVSLAAGDLILLKNQTVPAQNGQYIVTTVGTGSNGVWDRNSTDYDVATTAFTATAQPLIRDSVTSHPGIICVINGDGFTNCRYLSVGVSDEDALNADGGIILSNLWVSDAWEPSSGPSFGWTLGYEDPSIIETSLGGVDYIDPRPKYRVLTFGVEYMLEDEWASHGLAMTRDLGVTEPLLFVMSTTDAGLGERVSFMGRLRTLSPIENPYPLMYSTSFELKELIA